VDNSFARWPGKIGTIRLRLNDETLESLGAAGGYNPTLTIQALAWRIAEAIAASA